MPKKIAGDVDVLIVEVLSRYANGLDASYLHSELGVEVSHRTLQRRLAQKIKEGRIVSEGSRRGGIRYRLRTLADKIEQGVANVVQEAIGEYYIPLSAAGEEVKAYVRQPRHMRKPVGYDLGFLEAYIPNQTFYLPEDLRKQLRQIGTPPDGERPAGTFARDILNRLLIDLSWASSRLEGNTYSRLDTERLIEFGQAAEGKDAMETQMILNHKAAIEFLVHQADTTGFTPYTILSLHALLSDGLLADPKACGRIRNRPISIGGSVYIPIAMPQRVEELFGIILEMSSEIKDPFEQSLFVMVHLPYLQPFEDVNKRVSRLAANIPFIRENLCPLSFIDVPERAYIDAVLTVYELNRVELLRDVYVWAYERSCQQYLAIRQELVPPDAFRLRYRKALNDAIKAIVGSLKAPSEEVVNAAVPASVSAEDRRQFVALVLAEFASLHEGNAIRFGIRPVEFAAWQAASKKSSHPTKG